MKIYSPHCDKCKSFALSSNLKLDDNAELSHSLPRYLSTFALSDKYPSFDEQRKFGLVLENTESKLDKT